MPKIIRRELSDEAIEHLRELRSIAYKSDRKVVSCKQKKAKDRSGQKCNSGTENNIDSLAREKEKLNAGDVWISLDKRVKNSLITGDRYIIRHGNDKCEDPLSDRSMIFVRIVNNRMGQPLFIFKSNAGYLETFTLQQLRDCTLRGGAEQCELW